MAKQTVGLAERVQVIGSKGRVTTWAKFDTGAMRTSVDYEIAAKTGLGPITRIMRIKSASRRGHQRIAVPVRIRIKGQTYEVEANLADRSHSMYKVLVGRDIIFGNFVVDISRSHKGIRESDLKEK